MMQDLKAIYLEVMHLDIKESSYKSMSGELQDGQSHHQNWYVVAFADEVKPGKVVGKGFLNTRVAIYRKDSGEPVVMTARCPHMGADLSLGDVVENNLRCSFHHFCFNDEGQCNSVPSEGPVPPGAKTFSFPTVERFGLIWAFNGEKPLFPPPEARDYKHEDLVFRPRKTHVFDHAPFVNIANVFDFLHLKYVHGLSFKCDIDKIRYLDDFHIESEIDYDSEEPFESRIRITGTNTVAYTMQTNTTSVGLFTMTPVGKQSHSYSIAAAINNEGHSPEQKEERLNFQKNFADMLLVDDIRTLSGIQFKVGTMLREEQALVNFLKWVHQFPSAYPSLKYE